MSPEEVHQNWNSISARLSVRAFRQETAKTDRCLVPPAWRPRKTSPNDATRKRGSTVCPFALRNRQTAQRSLQPQAPRLLYPPATPLLPRRPTLCASAEGGVSPPGGLLVGVTRESFPSLLFCFTCTKFVLLASSSPCLLTSCGSGHCILYCCPLSSITST